MTLPDAVRRLLDDYTHDTAQQGGITSEAANTVNFEYIKAFLNRLETAEHIIYREHLILVGYGLRKHPGAPCEWYLAPHIDTTTKPNTGSNTPPVPPWEPVYRLRSTEDG